MKVISISQPFASLKVKGFKVNETRTWPAPRSVIGQIVGIASTKTVKPVGHEFYADEKFAHYYTRTGMPPLEELPNGCLLGYGTLLDSVLMTEEYMDDVSEEEKTYGFWEEGFYAWQFINMVELPTPIPVRGAQGIWEWHGDLNAPREENPPARASEEGSPALRQHLRLV
ncbi:hypothetical protein [Agrobacterium sp. CG674]